MKDKIVSNIVVSVFEKILIMLFQLLIAAVMIRTLDRSIVGVLAIVTGYFALLNFINFPLENNLLRESKILSDENEQQFNQYFSFSVKKVILFGILLLIAVISILLIKLDHNYIFASISIFLILAHDIIVSPFIIYCSLRFRQDLVLKMSFIRWSLSLLLLLPLFLKPDLRIVAVKDAIVLCVSFVCWRIYFKKRFNLQVKIEKINIESALHKFKNFTLWTHLTGAVTNLIYKADAVVLSFFSPLNIVGNYNISLNAANIANIIPSLLAYQNSVAIAHADDNDRANRLTLRFFRLSLYLSGLTLLAYLVLGKLYLRLLTGVTENDEIFVYMINIVIGLLIVKTLISPLVAFINVRGNVRKLFLRVKLPLFIICVTNYILASYFFGAMGLSVANVINAVLWVLLILLEIRQYNFKIKDIFNWKEDLRDIVHYAKNLKLLR